MNDKYQNYLHKYVGKSLKTLQKQPQKKLVSIITVLVCLGVVGGYWGLKETTAAPKHTINYGVGALGRIEPRSTIINVYPKGNQGAAVVRDLLVKEGDNVKKGQDLIILADHDIKQYQFEAAEAQVAVLEAKIKSQDAELERASEEFERRDKLAKNKAISASQKDDAELRLKTAQAALASLKAELASAHAKEKEAKDVANDSIITSPLDGTVLAVRAHPGEIISDSGALDVANLSKLDVVAEVFELDIMRVKKGQKVEITIPGSTTVFHGVVRTIGYIVEKNKLNHTDPLKSRDNRIVEVKITITEKNLEKYKHLLLTKVNVKILPND